MYQRDVGQPHRKEEISVGDACIIGLALANFSRRLLK